MHFYVLFVNIRRERFGRNKNRIKLYELWQSLKRRRKKIESHRRPLREKKNRKKSKRKKGRKKEAQFWTISQLYQMHARALWRAPFKRDGTRVVVVVLAVEIRRVALNPPRKREERTHETCTITGLVQI